MALREILTHFGFDFDAAKADQADKKVEKIKKHSEEASGGVAVLADAWKALVAVEIARKAAEWVESISEQADAIGDLSEATGLSTRDLQIWQFGAKKTGEEAEVFTAALRKLSAAAAGGVDETGSASKIFDKLGIKTKDAAGKVKDLSVLLPEIAEHFARTEDGAGKAALAQELFGRGGTKLIPLLNQGAEGIKKLGKEFDKLGGGFDPEAIARAGDVKVAIARVGVAFNGLSSELAIRLLPKVADLLEGGTHIVVMLRDFAESTTVLDGLFGSLATTIGVSLWGALSPFLFGALKFAAIYLAVDDLKGFLEGQDSEIGSILDDWFGDGSADGAREWCNDAISDFGNFANDFRAVWDVAGLDFTIFIDRMIARWHLFTLEVNDGFNSIADKIGAAGLKMDTTQQHKDFSGEQQRIGHLNAMRDQAEKRLESYTSASTPLSGGVATMPGPYAQTKSVTQWNTVENKQVTNITVPSGTPEAQMREIGRQVRTANRESHRAALQALQSKAASE